MTVSKKTALFGVDDCKIFPITADNSTAFTCSAGIDVPGIKQLSVTMEIDEKELTGDEKTLATSTKIKSVTFNTEYAELSQEVLKILAGGTQTSATGSETFRIDEDSLPGYFQLQAQIKGVDLIPGGDCHFIIYKAKANAMPINGTENDYSTFSFDGRGVFTECKFAASNGKSRLMDIQYNAAATNLTAVTYSA